jgi:Mrp family chromosome partitioning ATPase
VKQVSGVIVVCRLGKTTRESAARLRRQLDNLGAHVLGVVVNSVPRQASSDYGYGYGYGYAAEPTIAPGAANGTSRRRDETPEGDAATYVND